MEPIQLKCTNCGGELEFEKSMSIGFCKYCGGKVLIPHEPVSQMKVMSDTTKFFLLVYYKGEQVQFAIKDEVTLLIKYRNNAASGDPQPLGAEISTNGFILECKNKLSAGVGVGRIQIAGIGSNLTLTKDQKIHLNVNGNEVSSSIRLNYGDLVSVGNLIFRIQPMSFE